MNIWVVCNLIPGESLEVWGHLKRMLRQKNPESQIFIGNPSENLFVGDIDAVIVNGITSMEMGFDAKSRWPSAKFYTYNWDCYEWVWTNPREKEYNYSRFGELCKMSDEVWVPSDCTGRRTLQWWPEVRSVATILSAIPYWDHSDVRDDGYALCCLRQIPDRNRGLFEKCCAELNIPYKVTDHQLSQAEYRDTVAHCRFICAPFYELSTGGFSLMEAYYLGKPVLLNTSEWNGGRDYMDERAAYFKDRSDNADFKIMLEHIYKNPSAYVKPDHAQYIAETFSDENMAKAIYARIVS